MVFVFPEAVFVITTPLPSFTHTDTHTCAHTQTAGKISPLNTTRLRVQRLQDALKTEKGPFVQPLLLLLLHLNNISRGKKGGMNLRKGKEVPMENKIKVL